MKTCPCNIEIFFSYKNSKFHSEKKIDIFNIFAKNIDCGYTLEVPRRGGSNEYPQSMFRIKNKKNRLRHTPAYYVLLYKIGVQGGIHYTDMFS